ncbi:MAG: glycosyltransferase, partial [Lentisphaeria bacterium]|nr:glycosyltransferase [Lentisphaeria bacterium]
DVLLKAIEVLDNHDDFELVVMGNSSELLIPGVDVHYLGFIQDDILKAAVYAAADIFIIPSLEDNLPNTVLESIACGTPVIGSNVGGIPDMVRSGVTGDLFEAGNSQDLAFKLDAWMSRDDHELISKNCRKVAEEEYDQFVQAKAYQKLFETILGRN